MSDAIGQVLGNAVGVAISPVPVMAVILMLFSARAGSNSLAMLAGWVAGIAGVALVVLAVGIESAGGGESDGSGVVKLAVGALLLFLAVRQWRGRGPSSTPKWMAAVESFGAARSFGLGLALAAVNPKNLGLTVAAATTLGASGLSSGEELTSLAVFVALASVTVAGPIAVNVIAGDRAERLLDPMKAWLTENNATVMTVLLTVLGAKVLGDGIAALG